MLSNKDFGFSAKNGGGGGGNTVATDGISLIGNGTSGNTIQTTSAQPVYVFDTPQAIDVDFEGIYIVNAENCSLNFNSNNFIDGARVLVISNVTSLTIFGNETALYWQGTNQPYPSIFYSKGILEFILVNGVWRSYNNSSFKNFSVNIGDFTDYNLFYSGNYIFYGTEIASTKNLQLPDAFAYKGQQIQLLNTSNLEITIVSNNLRYTNGSLKTIFSNGSQIYAISIDGYWTIFN
jgi:hypothetical protein